MQIPNGDAELIAIHEAFAAPIFYAQVGTITAVEINEDAGDGILSNARRRTFEILQSKLFADPAENDRIDASGRSWYVIGSERRDDLLAWHVEVEWRA